MKIEQNVDKREKERWKTFMSLTSIQLLLDFLYNLQSETS
jgi:hypothetical protein